LEAAVHRLAESLPQRRRGIGDATVLGEAYRLQAAVRQYLTTHGVQSTRLTSHGYGFDRPLVPNDTDQNRALNRRVQFVRTEGAKEGCPPTSR
jgi:hypothetical protein